MWKNAFPCRCSRCRARRTFRKHPDSYPTPPPHCSCGGTFAVDTFRLRKEHKKYKCTCDLWWFPHRIGSHKQAEEMLMRAYEDRYYGDGAAA